VPGGHKHQFGLFGSSKLGAEHKPLGGLAGVALAFGAAGAAGAAGVALEFGGDAGGVAGAPPVVLAGGVCGLDFKSSTIATMAMTHMAKPALIIILVLRFITLF